MSHAIRGLITALCLAVTALPAAADTDWSFGGHLKYQFIYTDYPKNSIFNDVLGSSAVDNNLETRLKFSARRDRWDFDAHYQFIAIHADTLQLAESLPGSTLPINSVISDDRRWWDLT